MKDNIPEELEKEDDKGEDGKDTNNGLNVSDDEEDGGDQGADDEGNDDKVGAVDDVIGDNVILEVEN